MEPPTQQDHRPADAGRSPDLEPLLYELARLPDRLRNPLVACYLQSRTQPDAAADLGLSLSTLRRRLDRGRELLRNRLLARGATAAAGLLAVAPGLPAVPPPLLHAAHALSADLLDGRPLPPHLLDLTREGFPVTRTLLFAAVGLAVVGFALAPAADPAKPAAPVARPAWVTVTGRVVVPADFKPDETPLKVFNDKEHCLSGGPLLPDQVIVNPTNRGLRNVWVYLRPDDDDRAKVLTAADAHPDLRQPKPVEHVVDQPCCRFIPRVLAVRAGDSVRFKNSAPVAHNVNANMFEGLLAEPFNVMLPPAGDKLTGPLKAGRAPAQFKCDIHPWMQGMVMVFDHPYYALTDADGRFELKQVPNRPLRVVYRHERGFHKGRDGSAGFPLPELTATTVRLPEVTFSFP